MSVAEPQITPRACRRCEQSPCVCTEIRASSLASVDCWRRWAGENESLRPIFKKHGHEIPEDRDNAGSILGTSCHDGVGAHMQAKLDGYVADPLAPALRRFHKLTEKNPIESLEDETTPTKDVAVKQIERLLQEIMPKISHIEPQRVEFAIQATVDKEKHIYATGHPDCFDQQGIVHDWKFGKNLSAYDAQLGLYSLILRSTEGVDVKDLRVWWAPRRSLKSKLWGVQEIPYKKYESEQLASHLVEEAAVKIEKFKETGDLFAFTPNPNNNLCSKKWCVLWNSTACPYGRPEKSNSEGD